MFRLLLIILIAATLILPQTVLAKSKIAKARDYAQIEKKWEAKSLLDEAILDDPLDANVHHEAGKVYYLLGLNGDFDLAMKNTYKLKPSMGSKIAEHYYSVGFMAIDRQSSTNSAIRAFQKAFSYNPSKKQESIIRLFETGQDWLTRGNIQTAERYFYVLLNIDPQSQNKVADIYYRNALKSSSNIAITLFRKAIYYSKDYKNQAGHKLAEMAKDNKYSENRRATFKRGAGKYLSESEMLAYFPPDYIPYKIGFYTFKYKKGETSKQWINYPSGTVYCLSSKEDKF